MKVNLRLAEPNPFRDFRVDPVDSTNVTQLTKSIKEHGFWGGMVARRHPHERGVIQIIAGWHRREAALRSGVETADIFVGEFDDRQTVRAYADENATQRGNTSSAMAGSVAAAIREILLRGLRTGEIASERHGGNNRDGVGREAILKELEGVSGINDSVVKIQLANLKASGSYDRIVREVVTLIEEEQAVELKALAEAERQRQEAERREAEAKARRQQAEEDKRKAREERDRRDAEAKAARNAEAKLRAEQARLEADKLAKEAEERRKKAAEETERARVVRVAAKQQEAKHAPAAHARDSIAEMRAKPKHEVTFNERVARHFRSPYHVETFKRLATGHGKQYLPVEQQEQLAKALVAKAHADSKELTSSFIEAEFNNALLEPKFLQKFIDEKERADRKAELLRSGWQNQMEVQMANFSSGVRRSNAAVQKMLDLHRDRPKGVTMLATQEFRTAIEDLKSMVRIVEGKLI